VRKFLFPAACLFLALPAMAAPWTVDSTKSTLTFSATQAGEAFSGGFSTFTPHIIFDEAAPEKGTITVSVEMASLTVEGKDRMDALPTADWFAVKQFPTANFTSSRISKTGERAYSAEGILSIRGVSKPATLPFTLRSDGAATIAEGTMSLNRSDYGIGQGRWASEEWVAFPVTVRYAIHARKP